MSKPLRPERQQAGERAHAEAASISARWSPRGCPVPSFREVCYVDRLSKKQQAGPQRSACEHNRQRRNAQEQAGKKAGTDGGDPARGKSEYSRPNEDQGTVLLKRRSPCIMRLPDLGTKSISHKQIPYPAILHRPAPIIVVAMPSFIVELAYVRLPF
jgi:hypothetical protein